MGIRILNWFVFPIDQKFEFVYKRVMSHQDDKFYLELLERKAELEEMLGPLQRELAAVQAALSVYEKPSHPSMKYDSLPNQIFSYHLESRIRKSNKETIPNKIRRYLKESTAPMTRDDIFDAFLKDGDKPPTLIGISSYLSTLKSEGLADLNEEKKWIYKERVKKEPPKGGSIFD